MQRSTFSRLFAATAATALITTGLSVGVLGVPAHASHTATAQPMFSYTHGWRVDEHVREIGDVNGDGLADIIGFGDPGTFIAHGRADGTFSTPVLAVRDFGSAQGWINSRHVRTVADLDGDGRDDLVGFGDAGVYVSYAQDDGTFTDPGLMLHDFGYQQGWRVEKHPRKIADLAGDGPADIVGFGDTGVLASHARAERRLTNPILRSAGYGYDDGWRTDQHPRHLADMDGDGTVDIVGFGDAGAYVSYFGGLPYDFFSAPELEVSDFGYQQGWRVGQNPREPADVNGDGAADILGFGHRGVSVSWAEAGRNFSPASLEIENFGYVQGWRGDQHLRTLAHLNDDAAADIVGFGDTGVHVAHGKVTDGFGPAFQQFDEFGYNSGWTEDVYPRAIGDVNGDGQADIVGFGYSATYLVVPPTPAAAG